MIPNAQIFISEITLIRANYTSICVAPRKAGGRRDALFDGKPNLRATRTRGESESGLPSFKFPLAEPKDI